MIKMVASGSFKNTYRFFNFIKRREYMDRLRDYAEEGVRALSSATPVDTGKTAASWSYEIKDDKSGPSIIWTNSNESESGIPIVILLRYGHGTPSGHYVQGRDFITPAIEPIFDKIAENVWREVTD